MTDQAAERVDAEEVADHTPRRIRLATVEDVRVELARVYRDMRAGKVSMPDGTKLAYVLAMLAKVTDQSILEARLIELERQVQRWKGLGHVE
jgi:hypothetical protein